MDPADAIVRLPVQIRAGVPDQREGDRVHGFKGIALLQSGAFFGSVVSNSRSRLINCRVLSFFCAIPV